MYDFPSSPTTNQQVTGSGGQVYTFDGTKWKATATAAGVTSWNTRTGAVTMSSGDVTTALTFTPYNATNPSGYQTAAQVTTALVPYAPLASPTFTGTVTIPAGASIAGYAPLAAPVFTGDARAVTASYGDNDTSISTTAFVQSAVAPAFNDAGRNLVTNGTFVVQQRGAGPWAAPIGSIAYTADRWGIFASGSDAASISVQSLVDSDRAAIGDEAARYCLQNIFTGSAVAGSNNEVYHQIEGVRRLSGKTVTLSLWARSVSGGTWLGVDLVQNFGTGGSPSATVTTARQVLTFTTSWARYSLTFNLPSASGKTLGTNGDDKTTLEFWYSFQGVQVQSGTIQLYGVQLEIGSVATPLDAGGSPQQILAQCQRFYCLTGTRIDAATPPGAYGVSCSIALPVWMRASPTLTQTANASSNVSGIAYAAQNAGVVTVSGATGSGGGSYAIVVGFSASADL